MDQPVGSTFYNWKIHEITSIFQQRVTDIRKKLISITR
ncbi:hypothetical protein DSOL_1932 [Desulfosporosinus metallidurans]|uniref:Uncharacterized protein n=1 Tax=Desulfosporosinus metallidurans TaxID=1888891 RepID=A0A1Q8QXM0_9FIRM|nr:hypothetical protein DSOL_1932 [Desulfosporosinus metallidurans]